MHSDHIFLSHCSCLLRRVRHHDKPGSAEFRFSSAESADYGLRASRVVVEERMMADIPVLTTGSRRCMVLCPHASLDAEGSQPPPTTPEAHNNLVGPILLPPRQSEAFSEALVICDLALHLVFPE